MNSASASDAAEAVQKMPTPRWRCMSLRSTGMTRDTVRMSSMGMRPALTA